MKKYILTIIAVFALVITLSAQSLSELSINELKALDLSGRYVGKRNQYTPDRKAIMQSFEYEFDLVQTGDQISGTSTIIKANGQYADIKVRGTVVGNKLYFEEYEIVNQDKDPNMVWCFKSGALAIQKDGGSLKLSGITDSYIPDYYIPCTGGTTDLTKVDNSNNFKNLEIGNSTPSVEAAMKLAVSPNPFVDATKINYSLAADANVTLEIYDISGKRLAVLENNVAKITGTYSIDFSATAQGIAAGVLIAKLTANGKIYSAEMVQMK